MIGADGMSRRPARCATLLYTLWTSVAAGALLGSCPAPHEWSAPAYLGLAYLFVSVDGPQGARWSFRRAFLAGYACSFVINTMALYWVTGLLEAFAGFPWFAAIPTAGLLFAAQALPFGIACALSAGLSSRGVPTWLALPPCIVVVASLAPSLFPWRIANSQTGFVEWIQLAEVGGQPLLDLFLAFAGIGLGRALVPTASSRERIVALSVALVAFLGPLAYGCVRLPEVRAERARAPVVRVGVVQPNVPIDEKHDPATAWAQLAELTRMTRDLESERVDLVVWPETAFPFPVPRTRRRDSDAAIPIMGPGVHGPLLVGAVTFGGADRRYNSAIAIGRDGTILGIADKVELLAFGEYTPLWDYLPPLHRFPRGFTPGDAPRVLTVDGADVGVLNCYEDVLDGYARRVAANDPSFLLNLTNDAWFGETSEPWLHEAVSRLRAIETRRDLVRVVNTGVSSHAAATGESLIRIPTFVRTSFVAEVRRVSGVTPWVRFGDWLTPMLFGGLLGAAAALRPRRH